MPADCFRHEALGVVFQVREKRLTVLLWRRAEPPFAGSWALPGGLLLATERLGASASRHLAAKVDIPEIAHLEQLETRSDPVRDPRERVLATAYLALVTPEARPRLPSDTIWHPVDDLPPTAFDHGSIVGSARERLRAKLSYTNIGFALAPETFTISQLRDTYAAALGHPLSATNLQRILVRRGVIEPTPDVSRPAASGGRPATLYRFAARGLVVTNPFAAFRPRAAETVSLWRSDAAAERRSGVLPRRISRSTAWDASHPGSMTSSVDFDSPVRLRAVPAENQPAVTPALEELYRGFERQLLVPLWTEIGDLMPVHPRSKATPHLWRWEDLRTLAAKAGELVPVGRGGERRAIALANPGLGGRPFATPTLWAAIQYLMPGEDAPEHRHTQHAFRFVLEGAGVWTVVDGDPVAMRRGDFLPQAGWHWHAHHNATGEPMAWLDGLDIPFQYVTEAQFFQPGRDELSPAEHATPGRSRAERLWGHPGLRPLGTAASPAAGSPLLAYRWEHTDRALADQLALAAEGHGGTVEPGHAAVRYANPATGGDVLPTIRVEMHRIARGAQTTPVRETGSSVYAVFDGSGVVTVGEKSWSVTRGDLFVVPSWQPFSARSQAGATDSDSGALDLFRFSDSPVFEALNLNRTEAAPSAQAGP